MTKPDYLIVIPARMASQRLPGKVLLEAGGKTLVQFVWEQARASAAAEVVIATDDDHVASASRSFGADVEMTSPDHASGSDRIAEVALRRQWDPDRIIVNLQGDEPEMPPACLDQVAALAGRCPEADVSTLFWPMDDAEQASDPNIVKLVQDGSGRALLFSRALIPHIWDGQGRWKRHIGLYAYRCSSLVRLAELPRTPLEQAERLEQLRCLEHGGTIVAEQACLPIPPGIDTPADFEAFASRLPKNS